LYSIARNYGVSVAALSEANELTTTSYLHPDDQLIIPASVEGQAPTATVSPDEVVHTVQEGERLSDIAQRYGTSEQELREMNNLEADARVRPGDTLAVPVDNGPTPTATPASTSTPTPGPPYAAPHLLYPLHNAELQGADQVVTLQWASAGILEADEWYALTLRYLGSRADGQPSAITIYTRITSWRVPGEWYPGQEASEHRFEWTVQVVRRRDLVMSSAAISPPGEVRRFRWQ
jgi:LysM repeat protein